jgi:hypothetical protein
VSVPTPPPPVPTYRIPSMGWRITVGALRLIPLVILLIGLPAALLTFLGNHNVALPLSILTVTVAGAVIVALSTARYIAKPYRAYGPISMVASGAVLAYLYLLLEEGTYTFAFPMGGISIGLTFTEFIELLMLVPGLALAAGLVTAIEDGRHPKERLPFDFPP